MHIDNNQLAFFELLRVGLWGGQRPVQEFKSLKVQDSVDWEKVYQLAQEQSLQGLVLQGIEWFRNHNLNADLDLNIPQILLLQWIGEVQVIEQRNKEMNAFLASLSDKLKAAHINALLVKGQGIALCYERPYWRTSGDVDLILDEENYQRGKLVISKMASFEEEENLFDKHYSAEVEGFVVELHGTMRGMLTKKADDFMDELQADLFKNNRFREWNNDGIVVKLPSPDDDVLFVFTHILKHFFNYGIGLRQFCDLCRLVYTYHKGIDFTLLESRLHKMGLMTEWKVFASFAVNWLGMPEETIPFYSSDSSWVRKANRVMSFVLETGNFGHNRDNSYYNNPNAIVRGIISLWRHTCDSFKHSFIFPLDSLKIWCRVFTIGINDAMKGK